MSSQQITAYVTAMFEIAVAKDVLATAISNIAVT
jgi:hypothetical protein